MHVCVLWLRRQVAWMLYDDDNGLFGHSEEAHGRGSA